MKTDTKNMSRTNPAGRYLPPEARCIDAVIERGFAFSIPNLSDDDEGTFGNEF